MVAARAPAARPERRIGRYLVTGRLGRGGMGMVYRGRDESLDRDVAIKTLSAEGVLADESRRRFEVEAKAVARLQHPNIITVFELGEDRGVPFIAMELLPGADLESVVRSGEGMPLAEQLSVVVQVLRGLAYAHERGVIHRDVKPSNIRLLDDGSVKLMDFGIAKLGATSLTRTGYMLGTVHYMSPEQVRAQPLDGRSDVFSVGVILYELLAGRRPFVGESATDVLYQIADSEPPALTSVALGAGGESLRAIVMRALAKDVSQRFPSAAAMADALAGLVALLRAAPAELDDADAGAVLTARRLAQAGRLDEAAHELATVVERSPDHLVARRLARAVARERARASRAEAPAEDFPELDATYQSPSTSRQPDTVVAAPVASEAPTRHPLGLYAAAAAALALSLGAALVLLRRAPEPLSTPRPAASGGAETASSAASQPPAGALARLRVVSDPPEATLTLDGKAVEGVTPLLLEIDTSRPHVVRALKGGFGAAEARLAAGPAPPEVVLRLQAATPPGLVVVRSSYPVDVVFKGRTLTQGETAARVELPSGSQTLTLLSARYFLRKSVALDVKPGVTTNLELPAPGRVSIRANPDNCEVSIDGTFLDYPPILERPLAAGSHVVGFKWPDGARREEAIEVVADTLAYVMGKRD